MYSKPSFFKLQVFSYSGHSTHITDKAFPATDHQVPTLIMEPKSYNPQYLAFVTHI